MPTKKKPAKKSAKKSKSAVKKSAKKSVAKKPAKKAKSAMKSANKTQMTGGSVQSYFAKITDPVKRAEVEQIHAMIRRIAPNLEPKVWGQFIGYGSYHYVYATGREGDWFVLGIGGMMKTGISVYACAAGPDGYVAEKHRDELKPASVGKSCIRFKSLAKMDVDALERVLKEAAAAPSFAM